MRQWQACRGRTIRQQLPSSPSFSPCCHCFHGREETAKDRALNSKLVNTLTLVSSSFYCSCSLYHHWNASISPWVLFGTACGPCRTHYISLCVAGVGCSAWLINACSHPSLMWRDKEQLNGCRGITVTTCVSTTGRMMLKHMAPYWQVYVGSWINCWCTKDDTHSRWDMFLCSGSFIVWILSYVKVFTGLRHVELSLRKLSIKL